MINTRLSLTNKTGILMLDIFFVISFVFVFISGLDFSPIPLLVVLAFIAFVSFVLLGFKINTRVLCFSILPFLIMLCGAIKYGFQYGVLIYSIFSLIFFFVMAIIPKGIGFRTSHILLKSFLVVSNIFVLFTIFEFVFPSLSKNIVSIILKGNPLTSELKAIEDGYGFAGFASSNNVITFAAYSLLSYNVFSFSKQHSVLCTLKILLYIFALIVNGQRSCLIFAPLCIFVVLFLSKKSFSSKLKLSFATLLLVLFAVLVAIIFSSYLSSFGLFSRINSSIGEFLSGGDVTSGRTVLYNSAINLFLSKPLFGNGFFGFYYNSPGLIQTLNSHTHNILLELLSDVGIFGTLIIFISLCYPAFACFKDIKNNKNEHYVLALKQTILSILLFILFDSFLHVTLYNHIIIPFYYFAISYYLILKKRSLQ